MRFLQRVAEQLKQVWLGMSMARRVSFVVLSALCLAVIVGVGYWASQPDYRVLYSGLSVDDASAITAKLQAQNTSFRLTSGGTSILVPAEQVQQLRLDLAAEGLPAKGGKGFEILDGSSIGLTPFLQQVNYSRALQAELAKTIMQLEPVAYARVHIVRPESTPFVRDQKPTTASVVLKLKPNASLNPSVAASIVALVAGAVEGLKPEQVTVLDTSGRILSEQGGSESGAVPSSLQLDHKRRHETYLAKQAEEMLAQYLGPGHAIVRVAADINFKTLTETREQYDQGRVLKEDITSHKSTSSGGWVMRGSVRHLQQSGKAGPRRRRHSGRLQRYRGSIQNRIRTVHDEAGARGRCRECRAVDHSRHGGSFRGGCDRDQVRKSSANPHGGRGNHQESRGIQTSTGG